MRANLDDFLNSNRAPLISAGLFRPKVEVIARAFRATPKVGQRAGLRYPPNDCWPSMMRADMAAAYVDERSVSTFLKKRGKPYPPPVHGFGRRGFWSKASLDAAATGETNIADDLSELI